MQSAYSELSGALSQTNLIKNLTHTQQFNIKTPFKVRNSTKVAESLGPKAIINGFIPVPVYTFKDATLNTENDDLSGEACDFLASSETYMKKLDQYYEPHLELIDRLKEPIGQAL